MTDLEKVIYSIERCICHVPDACRDCAYDAGQPYNECVDLLLKDTLSLLKAQEPGWISVKDRLPETNDEVLTTYVYDDKPGKRYVETANYWDDWEGEGHWNSVWDEYRVGNARETVIAWMPMPKPYEPPKEET